MIRRSTLIALFLLLATSAAFAVLCMPTDLIYFSKTLVNETGQEDQKNYGLVGAPDSNPRSSADRDTWHMEDDCSRTDNDTNFAEQNWTWMLVTPPQPYCLWQVTTSYQAQLNSHLSGVVDDSFDCDFSSASNKIYARNLDSGEAYHVNTHIKNTDNKEESGTSDNPALAVATGPYTSPCVPNGTLFTCQTRIESHVYIKSEASAHADAMHPRPVISYQLVQCE